MDTSYGKDNYFALNFNTIPSALVTLICLLHVSGWDVVCDGLVSVTSKATRLFFSGWYLVGVLFMMNIVTSVFISAFLVEASAVNGDVAATSDHIRNNHADLQGQDSMNSSHKSNKISGDDIERTNAKEAIQVSGNSYDNGAGTSATRKHTVVGGGKMYIMSVPETGSHGMEIDGALNTDDKNEVNAKFMRRIQKLSLKNSDADNAGIVPENIRISYDDFL